MGNCGLALECTHLIMDISVKYICYNLDARLESFPELLCVIECWFPASWLSIHKTIHNVSFIKFIHPDVAGDDVLRVVVAVH